MKALDKIREIKSFFEKKLINNPQKESEEIVANVLKINKVKILTENPIISSEQLKLIESYVNRRLRREPLEYILGECDFCDIKLKVGPGVLIPRPETEIIIEEFKKKINIMPKQSNRVIDLCTGSGCIALSIAREFPQLKIFGIDISMKALLYANENKKLNKVENAYFLIGDLFAPIKYNFFMAITSNPPYVKSEDIETLQTEVRDYEPDLALNGGEDGLLFYRQIIQQADRYLLSGGLIFFEMGINQSLSIEKMAKNRSYKIIEIIKDLAGIERVMILKKS